MLSSLRPLTLALLQPVRAMCYAAAQPAASDLWRMPQLEHAWRCNLWPLVLGGFNHSLQGATLLTSLQPVTFGECFSQGLQDVVPPRAVCDHRPLPFGEGLGRILQGVCRQAACSYRPVTFGEYFGQGLQDVSPTRDALAAVLGVGCLRTWEDTGEPAALA